ncbi:MAG: DoxX family protein [Deltaproteobacteria bacterium]|nr:DoxX family protein [Deltaproteobacteria bacterium]
MNAGDLERAKSWIDARRDIFLDLIRVYLGFALIGRGLAFAWRVGTVDLHAPSWAAGMAAHYLVPVHLFGGLLLAIGLVTRAAALANVPILVGAALFVHGREGLFTRAGSLELDLLVLFLLGLFVVVGAGRLSVDHYLAAHASRSPRPSRPMPA